MPQEIAPPDLIAQIAAQKLGPAPQAAGGAPLPGPSDGATAPQGQQQAPGAPAPAPQAPQSNQAPTAMEQAQAKVAPNDNGAQQSDEPFTFLKVGDKEYTENQLKGTLDRYSKLNFKHQTVKPIMDVVEQMMEAAKQGGAEAKPEDMAALVHAAVRAYVKDPQMGQQSGGPNGTAKAPMSGQQANPDNGNPGNAEDELSKWEKENAVSLPPGYKESMNSSKETSAKIDQLMQMFQNVMQGVQQGQGAQAQAAQATQVAHSAQADAATNMVTNNLTTAFQKNGLASDDQTKADFRMFAAQRGYDFPDFLDPQMAATVVADYKANKDAPEIQRLRAVAQKRQAFTGNTNSAPGVGGAGGPAAAGAGADPMLGALIQGAMAKRNM